MAIQSYSTIYSDLAQSTILNEDAKQSCEKLVENEVGKLFLNQFQQLETKVKVRDYKQADTILTRIYKEYAEEMRYVAAILLDVFKGTIPESTLEIEAIMKQLSPSTKAKEAEKGITLAMTYLPLVEKVMTVYETASEEWDIS